MLGESTGRRIRSVHMLWWWRSLVVAIDEVNGSVYETIMIEVLYATRCHTEEPTVENRLKR